MSAEYHLTHYEMWIDRAQEGLLDAKALAHATGLPTKTIDRLYRQGVLEAEEERQEGPFFAPMTVLRLRRIRRLRRDLGLSWDALAVVGDLLERIDALEAKLRRLEKGL